MKKVCPYCGRHVDCSTLKRRGDGRVTCPHCQGKFTPECEPNAPEETAETVFEEGTDDGDSARNQGPEAGTTPGDDAPDGEDEKSSDAGETDEERLKREARNARRREARAAQKTQS